MYEQRLFDKIIHGYMGFTDVLIHCSTCRVCFIWRKHEQVYRKLRTEVAFKYAQKEHIDNIDPCAVIKTIAIV